MLDTFSVNLLSLMKVGTLMNVIGFWNEATVKFTNYDMSFKEAGY